MANDRVIRGVDNRRQALPGFFGPFTLRDVAGEAACMDKLALLPQHVGVEQDMLDRPILADQAGLVVLKLFAGMQAPQDIRNHGLVRVELGNVVPEIFVTGIAEQA